MFSFGEKCPNCSGIMLIKYRGWIAHGHDVAFMYCLDCRARVKAELQTKPVRTYRSLKTPRTQSTHDDYERRRSGPRRMIGNYGYHPDPKPKGLGISCLKCDSDLRIRSSRRILKNRKTIYLDCLNPDCGQRFSTDVRITALPPLAYHLTFYGYASRWYRPGIF
ncbi:ogr/Delta-like zinc finger family protein [uncultured Kushneria sp.]|uniref:ogr/Delta-like zinc finger family protein n=1 Tax=uncultured Kushneria sp. TaxID=905033 RepID=UPI00345B298B